MIVGLMGNDGSGKTTLGRRVADALRQAGLRVQQRSEFDYFLLRYPLKLVPRGRKDAMSTRLVHETVPTLQRARWLRAWPLVVLADFAAERAFLSLRRRSVVLTDRFAYDSLMSWESLGLAGPRTRRLYLSLPAPDVGLVLDAPPEVAHERKRDTHWYPPSYYEEQRTRYHAMARERGLPLVRTDRPLDESVADVLLRMGDERVARLPPHERVLLRLATRPERVAPEEVAEADAARLVALAARVGVEAKALPEADRVAPGVFDAALAAIRRRRDAVLATLDEVDAALGDVPRVFVKTFAEDDALPSDLDLLVPRDRIEDARARLGAVLRDVRATPGHPGVTLASRHGVEVDLHADLAWAGIRPVEAADVLAARRVVKWNGRAVPVPAAGHEFAIVAAHGLLQHHYTTLGELLHLAWCARDAHAAAARDVARAAGWQRDLDRLLGLVAPAHLLLTGRPFGLAPERRAPLRTPRAVLFHPHAWIRARARRAPLEHLATPYRRLRYHVNGTLPYNVDWLTEASR